MVRFKLQYIILSAALSFFSCNYGFKGASPPEGIRTIYIPTISDQSGFGLPDLGESMTVILKNKFIRDNTLEYAEKTSADGMLTCIITRVLDEALVVSQGEQVSKRKITITVSAELQNLRKSKKIWSKEFSNWGEYDSSEGGFSKRDDGINSAVDKITDDVLLEVISNW